MILETLIKPKRFFNTNDKKDIATVKKFFETHAWGTEGCPFILEYPYHSVPDMIKDKLLYKTLNIPYTRAMETI